MEGLGNFCFESLVGCAKIIQMVIANCVVKDYGMGKISGITAEQKTVVSERSPLNAQ